MAFIPGKHHRRSIRLKGYDYSRNGAYFITVCAQNRACLFGNIVDGEIVLNGAGQMIQTVWDEMPKYYPNVEIDAFQIMPNHVHGIVCIATARKGQPWEVAPTTAGLSLPDIVHRFKTMTTKKYIDGVKQYCWQTFDGKLWQRNYYEHIIRNENGLNRIREYIVNNPNNWENDKLFAQRR